MQKTIMLGLLLGALNLQAAEVLTWVPAYSIPQSYAMLNKDFGGVGMKDGLTRLALQFWRPTYEGRLEKDPNDGGIADAEIKKFSDWATTNNISLLLCIYNPPPAEGKPWEWSRAQAALNKPEVFVNAVMTEIDRLEHENIVIAGVDMDLESSIDESDEDRVKYIAMMKLLSKTLKQKEKILSAATYASKWNAPNIEYWPQLAPFVDGITPMAYEKLGYKVKCEPMWNHPNNWCSYSGIIQAAGKLDKKQLTLGMPGNVQYGEFAGAWMGKRLLEQLKGAQTLGAGVAIWDSNLHPSWQKAEVWHLLHEISSGVSATTETSASSVAPDSFNKTK